MAGTKVAYRAEAAPAPTRLERLRLLDFGEIIKYAGTIAAATTFALGGVGKAKAAEEYLSSGLSTQSEQVLPRSTEDRPDDLAGRQIHVVYAVPSDGGNLNSDISGDVNQALANMDNYLENRGAPGLRWRIDLYGNQPDITYFQFDKSGAELSQMDEQDSVFLNYANAEIKKAGLNNSPLKIYNVLYEGTVEMPSCGAGGPWPTVFIGGPAAQANTVLTFFKEIGCTGGFTTRNIRGLLFNMGFATKSAPHWDGKGATTDDPRDVIWKDSWRGDWDYRNSMIDPGHDDYFRTGRPDDLTRVNYVTWPLSIVESNGENGNVIYLPSGVASAAASPPKPDPGNRFPGGTEITLKAEGQFVRWDGDCAQETDDTCDLLMDRSRNVIAIFKETVKKTKEIRVAIKKKLGGGIVTGSGVKCPTDCKTSLQEGKELALTAKPNRISRVQWIGGCARKIGNKCIVNYGTTDAPKTATVVFSRK